MSKKTTIIGCGVSGLTIGILLLEKGHEVEIVTKELPKDTTSAKAAAVWFPYEAEPKDKVSRWSKESYEKFLALCDETESGVSMIPMTVIIQKEEDAWWVDALPDGQWRRTTEEELPSPYSLGYLINVPLAETHIYLDYLVNKFKKLGGTIIVQEVKNLDQFSTYELVINCTGLGSRELVDDKEMIPIHGQIVKAVPKKDIQCITAEFTYGEKQDQLAYVFPRTDCIVLGGTCVKGLESLEPNSEYTHGIIERCRELEPNLGDVEIQSVTVGLRPGRSSIRIERDGNIIHNYGHGGAGFTVSWGCAMEVIKLINKD